MTEATLENFTAFVDRIADETPDREIDHTTWTSCAVGDFAREELGYKAPFSTMDLSAKLFGPMGTDLNSFMAKKYRAETYAGFRDELNHFLEETREDD